LDVTPEDLETEDQVIYVKGQPETNIAWGKVIPSELSVIGIGDSVCEQGRFPTLWACFVEIEADTETGGFNLENVVMANNVGQIIDPGACAQQAHFALVMDGSKEAYILDKTTGYVLNASRIAIERCTFADLPDFQVVLTENYVPDAPFGAMGLGESAGITLPQAVMMAVYNVTGTVMELPITPDKVLAALGKV
jgi:CO/xanthine dehydrogenase Mo-binding subunit